MAKYIRLAFVDGDFVGDDDVFETVQKRCTDVARKLKIAKAVTCAKTGSLLSWVREIAAVRPDDLDRAVITVVDDKSAPAFKAAVIAVQKKASKKKTSANVDPKKRLRTLLSSSVDELLESDKSLKSLRTILDGDGIHVVNVKGGVARVNVDDDFRAVLRFTESGVDVTIP